MPQLNTSESVRSRLRHLLQRLIDFANHELTDCDYLESKIRVRWVGLETPAPQLIVKTEIRFLAALVSATVDAKTKEHLKQDLRTLKDFVGRLEDNRDRTQGTGLWHFTLKLWHRSAEKNLIAFDELWQQRKASTKRAIPKKVSPPLPTNILATPPSDSDSQLDQTSAVSLPLPAPSVWPMYHNLPARDYGTFIGRAQVLEQLIGFLDAAHPVSRISLTGIGGMGKTALALEAAHLCLAHRQSTSARMAANTFSALVFVSAKTQRLTPQGILPSYRYSQTLQDVFRAIAQTLKRPDILAGDFEHQLENTYELLSWQRTLLILDNLESLQSKDQQSVLSFLYELPTTVKAIVTSRKHLTMDAIIPLQPLAEAEGLQFIEHQALLKSITLSQSAVASLHEQTGGVPAAVVYALGQVAAGYSVLAVLPRLTQQTSDYCRYYLESTIKSLQGQPSYNVLLALALFPSVAPAQALIHIAQLTEDEAAESFATLQQLALLTPLTPPGLEIDHSEGNATPLSQCFSMLPLTREYLLAHWPESSVQHLRERWLEWHQVWLSAYCQLSWRAWHDYSSIDAFWENAQAVVDWCIATSREEDFELLWAGLKGYTQLRGYWNERQGWLTWWLAIAQQKEDSLTTMKALRDLGWTLTLMGQPQQLETANRYFAQAWEHRHEVSTVFQLDLAIEAAILCLFQNRLADVQPWLNTAEALLTQTTLTSKATAQQQIRLRYYTAQLYYRQGDYAQAKSLYHVLLDQVSASEQQAEVYILNWLVDIALQQSNLEEAEDLLARSWPMIEHRRDMRSQAFHLRSKAKLEQLRGNLSNFERWTRQAKSCFERLGMQPQVQEMQDWLTKNPIL